MFSFLILWKTEECVIKNESLHHSAVFNYFSGALAFQVFVIMASAFMRLSLYEDAYGFTTLRLYSHAFILFLCVVFLVLLYKIFWDRRENIFAHRIFLSVVAFLVCMNLLNPNAFIARQNITHFTATPGKLDTSYLSRLSADAIPETIDILVINSVVQNIFMKLENSGSEWQSMNLARIRAEDLLRVKFNVSIE